MGGAGGTGADGSQGIGTSGPGLQFAITGDATKFYGVGGCALYSDNTAFNGEDATGNGGNGGYRHPGGNGGSGLVVIRYEVPQVPYTATPYSAAYDGSAHGIGLTVGSLVSGVTATIRYSATGEEGTYTLTTAPQITNVADSPKSVYFQISAPGYITVTNVSTITIAKGSNSFTKGPTIAGWTYGDAASTPSATTTFGGTTTYTYSSSVSGTYEATVPSTAGTWYMKATSAGTDNYDAVTSDAVSFTITQKEAQLAWSNTTLPYNANYQKPTCTVANLCSGDSCTVTVAPDNVKAVGTYTATATALDNANYVLPADRTTQFTITIVYYGWKGGASGRWRATNWVGMSDTDGTLIEGYSGGAAYPNSGAICPVFTNNTPAADVDMFSYTDEIGTMYFKTPNRVCLYNGGLTSANDVRVESTGEVVFSNMTFKGSGTTAGAKNKIFGTVANTKITFMGNCELGTVEGKKSTFTVGFDDFDNQTLCLLDGMTTLGTDVSFVNKLHIYNLAVTNACVTGVRMCPGVGGGDLKISVKLGENNTTANAVLNFSTEVRLNKLSTLFVDASEKTKGVYKILSTPLLHNNIADDKFTFACDDDHYAAEWEGLPHHDNTNFPNCSISLHLREKVTVPTPAQNLVYNGNSQTGVAASTGYTVEGGAAKDAGEHTATVKLEPDYCWTDGTTNDQSITWSIAKKELTVEGLTAVTREFNYGTNVTLTGGVLVGVCTGDDVGLADGMPTKGGYDSPWAEFEETTKTVTSFVPAFSLSGTDAKNYTLKVPVVKGVVKKATITEFNLAATKSAYTGTVKTNGAIQTGMTFVAGGVRYALSPWSVAGVPTNYGQAKYEFYADSALTQPATQAQLTNVGTIYVVLRGAGSTSSSSYMSQAYEITNANFRAVSVAQTGTLTYTGSAQAPSVAATATTVDGTSATFTYSLSEGGPFGVLPTVTDKGTYTYYYRAAAANHNTASGSFTVTVGAKNIADDSVTVTLGKSVYEYNGTARTPTVTVKDGKTTLTVNTSYTVVYTGSETWSSEANPATVTVTGTGNYTGTRTVNYDILPNRYTWVGPEIGGSWSNAANWKLEGYAAGKAYPGQYGAKKDANAIAVFNSGTYRIDIDLPNPPVKEGTMIKELNVDPAADLTFVAINYQSAGSLYPRGTNPAYNGKITLLTTDGAQGAPGLALSNDSYPYVNKELHVYGHTNGVPTTSYFVYGADNALMTFTDCRFGQATWTTTHKYVAFYNPDNTHVARLAITNTQWYTEFAAPNTLGTRAEVSIENSDVRMGMEANNFGGTFTIGDSLAAFNNATPDSTGDSVALTGLNVSGPASKFVLSGEATLEGALNFKMPSNGFTNDIDLVINTQGSGHAGYVSQLDVTFSGVAPVAIMKGFNLSGVTVSVDASALPLPAADTATRYPLVRVGSGILTPPAATNVTGVAEGYVGVVVVTADGKGLDLEMAHAAEKPAAPAAALYYTGEEQTGVGSGTGYAVTDGAKTQPGQYTAAVKTTVGYRWKDDESTNAVQQTWEILPKYQVACGGKTVVVNKSWTDAAFKDIEAKQAPVQEKLNDWNNAHQLMKYWEVYAVGFPADKASAVAPVVQPVQTTDPTKLRLNLGADWPAKGAQPGDSGVTVKYELHNAQSVGATFYMIQTSTEGPQFDIPLSDWKGGNVQYYRIRPVFENK